MDRIMLIGKNKGFTLIELLVVLTIIILLAGIVAPVTITSIKKAKESALKQNLYIMRKAINDFYEDKGYYPEDIEQLVKEKYLRKIPKNPFADSEDGWVFIFGENEENKRGIIDIKSGYEGKSSDNEYYQEW